jgi:hypothetical protein
VEGSAESLLLHGLGELVEVDLKKKKKKKETKKKEAK